MLQINIDGGEFYNENTNEFVTVKGARLNLEHSLVSISKWEAKWMKPFFSDSPKTTDELLDYIRCMTINSNQIDDAVYSFISSKDIQKISSYISSPMTATTFNERGQRNSRKEIVTSELVYYWMVAYGVPFECEKWHINRLLTLIRICSIKNTPPKKMSKRDTINYYKNLNEARKASLGTRG